MSTREIYGYGRGYKDIIRKQQCDLLNQEKEISSKEMFKKINYKLYEETDSWITYRKYPDTIVDDDTYQEIFYNFVDDFVVATEYNHGKLEEKFITREELLVINKLIEEFDDLTGLKKYPKKIAKLFYI